MFHYEYTCNACKKNFTKAEHLAEHDERKTTCPHCGSNNAEQSWSKFSVVTSRKS